MYCPTLNQRGHGQFCFVHFHIQKIYDTLYCVAWFDLISFPGDSGHGDLICDRLANHQCRHYLQVCVGV